MISGKLKEHGVGVILTGGACAALYALRTKAQSLDFVISEYHVEQMTTLMETLGFQPKELRSFTNTKAPFEIHFVPAPATVGDEVVTDFTTLKSREGVIALLTPTDCVRHRLAAWYRWGDDEAFEQAVAVAKRHPVNLPAIARWSEWEWSTERYEEFLAAVRPKD